MYQGVGIHLIDQGGHRTTETVSVLVFRIEFDKATRERRYHAPTAHAGGARSDIAKIQQ